ncbi:pitrilysin family protein [Shewanella sp. ULN5]|uniref:M16 family metallopeptidase n=1 Tax=Shewanella sp. ULN5 TaxID=2994678 RepID=UPI00273E53BF|nr:pitrilysin family protein [Shewanella sp. ULN5]MDP5146428.1 pitrilysin family protein [Shewanella sp. ULN5]
MRLIKQSIKLSLSALAIASALSLTGCVSTVKNAPETVVETGSFSLPQYQTVSLSNGLKVNLMVQKEVPLITLSAVVRAGAVNDTTSGLASITAQSLMLGAGGQSKAKIEQTLDFMGASLNTAADQEGSYIDASFMTKDIDKVLPIFSHVVMVPDFDSTEFAKLQQREIVGLSQQKESPRAVIGRYFNKLVFGDHPYANPSSGNSESIATLTIEQLRAFHKGYYQPSNMTISVVGDFDPQQMQAKLEQAFGYWQNTEEVVQANLSQGLPEMSQSKVLLVDKSDAIETTFVIGGMGISYDNPDYVGLTVVNTILGGRFTSWLNDELRVNAGLTYGARSGFVPYSKAGVFQISTFTKAETTKEAIDLALKTYARLWQTGIDQATLDSAKAYVKGQFPPKFETASQLAGLMSDMYLYGFDDNFINQFQAKVDGLTLDETQRLVKQYFPQQHLQYVLIGNASKIADIAKQYGEVTQVDIKDSGFGQ